MAIYCNISTRKTSHLTEGRSNLNEGNLSALTLDIVHRIRSKFCRKVGCTIAKGNIACFRG